MKSNDHERTVIFSEQKWFLQPPVWDGLSVGSDSLLLFDVIVLILVKGVERSNVVLGSWRHQEREAVVLHSLRETLCW